VQRSSNAEAVFHNEHHHDHFSESHNTLFPFAERRAVKEAASCQFLNCRISHAILYLVEAKSVDFIGARV
jgi:hypothetical protein